VTTRESRAAKYAFAPHLLTSDNLRCCNARRVPQPHSTILAPIGTALDTIHNKKVLVYGMTYRLFNAWYAGSPGRKLFDIPEFRFSNEPTNRRRLLRGQ
jgi:hypothetical protein